MIGEEIKKIRKSKRMTQKELSDKAELSVSYIQQLEYGKRENPSIQVLDAIAKALDIKVSTLTKDNEMEPNFSNSPIETFGDAEEHIKNQIKIVIEEYSGRIVHVKLDENDIDTMVEGCYKNIEFLFFKLRK